MRTPKKNGNLGLIRPTFVGSVIVVAKVNMAAARSNVRKPTFRFYHPFRNRQ
jgi:hypothetical protein